MFSFYFVSLIFVSGAEILDIHSSHKEKECYGTNMGFSFSGTHDFHYESLRRRYTRCTYVEGNLEVTNLMNRNVTYDLSFLSDIKVVTGYVLLGLLNAEVIPLTSLQLIRGDTTMKLGRDRYALVVALNSMRTPTAGNPTPGLKELQMPKLREITQGNVLLAQNPYLCYVDSIDWSEIGPGRVDMKTEASSKECGQCHAQCADADGVRRCWGAGKHMCQHIKNVKCHRKCGGKCFMEGMLGCCHPTCAVGCSGGMDTECELCKYFRYGQRCRQECPENTYPLAQECINF